MSTGTGGERSVYWSEYDPKTGKFIDKRLKSLESKKPKKGKLQTSEKPLTSTTK